MTSRAAAFALLVLVCLTFGCASKSAHWWRVGNCLVLYDQTGDEKQLVAVGQGCEIKRDSITAQGDVK